MGETEHIERRSSRALIFLVLHSRVAFMSKFSCLTSLKSFTPVTTDFRLFDCSTLNWSKSTRTLALHSEQMKVSEQHSSVEWSEDVMAAAAAQTPSTEVLAASATEGLSVVMETAALSLLTGVLSLSVERLGASAVTEAAGSENLRDPSAIAASPLTEIALSWSSVGMGVLVVMIATGAGAVLPSTEMALSLSSVGMGVLVVMTATGAVAVLPSTEMALSLSSVGMGMLVVMAATGAVLPSTEMALSLSSVGMGVLVVMTATGAVAVLPSTDMALSLSSVGMGVLVVMTAAGSERPSRPSSNGSITTGRDGVVAVVSGDGGDDSYWGCCSIPTDRDGVVAVVSRDGRAGDDASCRV